MQDQKNHLLQYYKESMRLDGRSMEDYRDVIVELGVSDSAEGSARVKIGGTEVIAGVKLSVEKPYPDTPDKGNLMVNAELLPMSSPDFETGPPSAFAIELSRVVDRGIRESKAIDVKSLCIKPGEQVWSVMIDICSINDEGNLFDAAGLAALAALKDAKFPELVNDAVNYDKKTDKSIPLSRSPIPVTILKIGDYFVVDPLSREEFFADARLTVAVTEKDTIAALQKGGASPLSVEEIDKIVALAITKAGELRKKL